MSEPQFPSTSLREIDLPSLGNRLSACRKLKGWSQRQLARRAQIRADRLSRLEQGNTEPRLEETARLAWVLGLGLEELAYGPEKAREMRAERSGR
jgi:transcriptional regulator with XRE-family HTH domain